MKRPFSVQTWVAIAVRTAFFAVTFWIVAEGRVANLVLAGAVVVVASAASLLLLPVGAFRVRAIGLLRFVPWFLLASIRGGLDVASRACRPGPPLEPGFVEYRLRLSSSAARMLVANTVSLLPGTLSVSLRDDRLRIHALDVGQPLEDRLRDLEDRVDALVYVLEVRA